MERHAHRAAIMMNWLQGFGNTLANLPVSWVDFLTIVLLLIGLVRGRKRGLSEEFLDTTQWVLIVVLGGLFYKTIGKALNQKPFFSLLTYYMFSYMLIALMVKLVFFMIKTKVGQKLIEGDVFGRFEFYGGMAAGAVRFACVYFFVLSLLHAPFYSEEYLKQRAKEVDYNYGSDFFPHPCKIQPSVFKHSYTGIGAEKFLAMLLIEPTAVESNSLRTDRSVARRNERQIDAIMGGR